MYGLWKLLDLPLAGTAIYATLVASDVIFSWSACNAHV